MDKYLGQEFPGAAETLEEVRNRVIDEEIKAFTDLCPELVIIEQ